MLKITPLDITIRDLTENYKDDGDGGVYGYNDHLNQTGVSAGIHISRQGKECGYRQCYEGKTVVCYVLGQDRPRCISST